MRVILVASTTINQSPPDYVWHYKNTLRDVPTDEDELGEIAGRLCYLSWDRPNPKTATNKGYLANIINQQHFSVLEHASATFYIDGVSRNFTHELIRHRHLSFSEVSQRYVDVSEFEFVGHPGLGTIGDSQRMYAEIAVENARGAYLAIVENLTEEQDFKRKEARQAARHVLPGGTETKILVTGNLRAWREVLKKRLSPQADAEFQLVAKEILRLLKEIAPNTFQDFEDVEDE